jgi:DNA-binding MarR family transcriptional regulator
MKQDSRILGDPGTPLFTLDKYPFYQLNRVANRYNTLIESRLRDIGTDVPSWRVLMILGEVEPLSIGRIADRAVINLSTMMRIIQRMRRDGLVLSFANANDRRVTDVSLTPAGRDKLAQARDITAPVYKQLIADFSGSDFDKLIDLLTRLNDNLTRIAPIDQASRQD